MNTHAFLKASIKLVLAMKLISCLYDLAAFDLKPETIQNKDVENTVVFKMKNQTMNLRNPS